MKQDKKLNPPITLSIVSHGNINEVIELLCSILLIDYIFIDKLILTINKKEDLSSFRNLVLPFKKTIITNSFVKGFGENHNNAFKLCNTELFLVLNPDIKFPKNFSFSKIINIKKNNNSSVISPYIKTDNKIVYPRAFPSIFNYLINKKKYFSHGEIYVDWISGSFMLFNSSIFRKIQGFDEQFFLYMEDIDICRKLKLINHSVSVDITQYVIHKARRLSHQNLQHFFFHFSGIYKYYKKIILGYL